MAGKLWPGLILLALILVLLIGFAVLNRGGPEALPDQPSSNRYPINRQVHWELTVRNQTAQAFRDVEVFSFLPFPETWQQQLLSVEANHAIEQQLDSPDQPVARVLLESVPPYGQRHIRFVANLAMADHFDNQEQTSTDRWLMPEPLIESDHQQVTRLATQLKQDDELQTARAIYDWLLAEITYSGYDPIDRGALFALAERKGDCTEYAALAVALARANAIPARLVNGYVVQNDGRLSPFAFHAWAELLVNERWLIVDAQQEHFDPAPEHYLATHYATSQARTLPWTRFFSPQPELIIEMR